MRALATALAALAIAAPAFADSTRPLTSQHWRDASPGMLEDESGIPSTVIDDWQRRQPSTVPGVEPRGPVLPSSMLNYFATPRPHSRSRVDRSRP